MQCRNSRNWCPFYYMRENSISSFYKLKPLGFEIFVFNCSKKLCTSCLPVFTFFSHESFSALVIGTTIYAETFPANCWTIFFFHNQFRKKPFLHRPLMFLPCLCVKNNHSKVLCSLCIRILVEEWVESKIMQSSFGSKINMCIMKFLFYQSQISLSHSQ